MYLKRHLTHRLEEYVKQFPCVIVLGARQVGKSTFLRNTLADWQQVDFESSHHASLVQADPGLFLRDNPRHVWFDEVQCVPALFSAMRHAIDRDRRPGHYVLSGSANPALVKGVSESLAGRAGILELGPLTVAEQLERAPSPFLSQLAAARDSGELLQAVRDAQTNPVSSLMPYWIRGGYPEPALLDNATAAWRWFDSYVRTVSERDFPLVTSLTPMGVNRLLRMAAARHGQSLVVADFARDLGHKSQTTAQYLDALEGAFMWRRVPPYFSNIGKRLVKSAKAYIVDSGLLHFLLRVAQASDLDVHPLVGASWEGWIIEQLVRQAALLEPSPSLYHWRTHAGAEADLVLETRGGRLIPIEIKQSTQVTSTRLRGLHQFLDDYRERSVFGVVIYRGELVARVGERVVAVPCERAVL